jgi:hypothetical protein
MRNSSISTLFRLPDLLPLLLLLVVEVWLPLLPRVRPVLPLLPLEAFPNAPYPSYPVPAIGPRLASFSEDFSSDFVRPREKKPGLTAAGVGFAECDVVSCSPVPRRGGMVL